MFYSHSKRKQANTPASENIQDYDDCIELNKWEAFLEQENVFKKQLEQERKKRQPDLMCHEGPLKAEKTTLPGSLPDNKKTDTSPAKTLTPTPRESRAFQRNQKPIKYKNDDHSDSDYVPPKQCK